jgi:hypothetical protein
MARDTSVKNKVGDFLFGGREVINLYCDIYAM